MPPDPASPPDAPALRRRTGRLGVCLETRGDCTEWSVEVEGASARAVAFTSLTGPLHPGDRVLLNTTAVALSLGTGGVHFVMARLDATDEEVPFPGREAGHLLKLRYTPLQHRVLMAEEEASPHREALLRCEGLDGLPVLAAELHSQAGAVAVAARAAAPGLRIVLVMLDTAALPLSLSRLSSRLRQEGVLDATVTVGQAFGGDYEAVNVYSGLLVARAAAGAELVIVTQGPGNAGTGTPLGFSGLGLVEALHACDTLGGQPLLAPRMSDADARERHQGVSHHTHTMLRCLHVPVEVPIPTGTAESALDEGCRARHRVTEQDPGAAMAPLEPYRALLTTMGRTLEQDPLFFRACAAAGARAADLALARREETSP